MTRKGEDSRDDVKFFPALSHFVGLRAALHTHRHTARAMNPASFLSLLPSWVLLVIIALITIYFVACLLPRSKIDVKGKYVLITGCDSGFGRQTAITLDKMGACVLATCLTKEGEQSLKSVTSDNLKTFQMDVTDSQQIKDVYNEVKKEIFPGTLRNLLKWVFVKVSHCRSLDV